jgi:hypothetical protein
MMVVAARHAECQGRHGHDRLRDQADGQIAVEHAQSPNTLGEGRVCHEQGGHAATGQRVDGVDRRRRRFDEIAGRPSPSGHVET